MKRIPIDLKFELIEYSNIGFSKGKCYVAYINENRNGSFISKEAFEKALPTMFGIPIVGEYLFDIKNEVNADIQGNYTDHDGIEMRPFPIGHIPLDATFSWEVEDGKEYLVVEGIILWTKRYPEANYVFDKKMNQSMEISINDEDGGYYDKDDNLYHISGFSFEALTVLGTDCVRNEDGSVSYRGSADVEPCFEGSHFDTYSMKTSFRKEYELMLKEFKNFNLQGGKIMSKVVEPIVEPIITEPVVVEPVVTEPIVEPIVEPVVEFTLSVSQISCAINEELSEMKVLAKDYWGEAYETQQYYMCDLITESKIVIVCDCVSDNCDCYGVSYVMTGDAVTLDFANKTAYTRGDWRPMVGVDAEEKIEEGMDFSFIKLAYDKKIETFVNQSIEKTKAEFKVEETEEYKTLNVKLEEVQEKYSKVEAEPNEKLQIEHDELKASFDKSMLDLGKLQGEFTVIGNEKDLLTTEFATLTSIKEVMETELNSYKLKEKELLVSELFAKEEFACLGETQEFKDLQVKAIDEEIGSVENELFVMLGKFASKTFSKKKEESQIMNFGVYKYEPKEVVETEVKADYLEKWCK